MRTALVHDWLTGMRGGEMVLETIAGLVPEAPIYTLLHIPGSISSVLEQHPIQTSFLNRAPGIRRFYRRYLPLFPFAIEDFDLAGFDLIISSSHCVAKGAIPGPTALHVCYCHSPMRYAWDQEHTYFPRRHGLGARLRGMALVALRTWDVATSDRVDVFMANSGFVAERIRRYYRREAEVVHPPVATHFFSATANEEAIGGPPYCLAVAALTPYKRLEVAAEACHKLGLKLRIVGTGPESGRIRGFAADSVEFLGRITLQQLRSLYRGAVCLVQPGIEDFGIAPVEALACGTPVVAYGRGGVVDVVEDGVHGVLYDDPSPEGLAAAIDRRRQIRFNVEELRSRADRFSTRRFLERFTSILGNHLARRGLSFP